MSQFQQRRRRQLAESCDSHRLLIRIVGIMTAFVLCGVGVDVYLHGYMAGLFILYLSAIILFLEVKWIITLFLNLIFVNYSYSKCLHCWSMCKYFGSWHLSFPYMMFGILLIVWRHNLWLSYVAGFLLILLAVLRLCLVCRFSQNTNDEGLLPQCDFEKVDSGPDTTEEGFVEIGPCLDDDEEANN